MHWRTPFPPKRPSVLAELINVLRGSLAPERTMALPDALPDECPPAEPDENTAEIAPASR